MPSKRTRRVRNQDALYWQQTATRSETGTFQHELPLQIKVRWDEFLQEVLNSKDEKQISRAMVLVDREMLPGDRLAKGTLAQIESETDSNDTNDTNDSSPDTASVVSWEIIRIESIPDRKAQDFVYIAYLA